MNIDNYLKNYGTSSLEASKILCNINESVKNNALNDISNQLLDKIPEILSKNEIDINNAKQIGLDFHIIDRLTLNKKRIQEMSDSILNLIQLPDPIGELIEQKTLKNGLKIEKVRVPLGVIGVIYESRPNVTTDISALCIKSGNSVILRGGKEAINTNIEICKIIRDCLYNNEMPINSVQLIDNPDRSLMKQFLSMNEYIDLMIPRGGSNLVNFVSNNAKMPSITGGIGVCHTYVDKDASVEKAIKIVTNAKVQRHTVCNALDTVIIHEDIAKIFLPNFLKKMYEHKVDVRLDKKGMKFLPDKDLNSKLKLATIEDYGKEFLDLIISIKIVNSLDKAIEHINKYGSRHSEAIITENKSTSETFMNVVDASAVFCNTSTRYNDGGEFGFGGEVAISTNKFHARGPMGIKELTIYKWKVWGNGQIRE